MCEVLDRLGLRRSADTQALLDLLVYGQRRPGFNSNCDGIADWFSGAARVIFAPYVY